ncbi:hypothetical protein BT96DRAFT_311689 [Gymnopus androsaceus JB14]|uniref:Uncharacterized protein n=1 Tax=Gymnopus androsaceus JB14 TaxID=1447944 RepID=A0A6A4H0W6_9AGAR|nr:hypothetical protein BT96DRAFT_311689 [Gymnopus androsaceus JB14]
MVDFRVFFCWPCIGASCTRWSLGFTATKQVAWILTTISSFIVTVGSLPFIWNYVCGPGDVKSVRLFPELAVLRNGFFQTYLLAFTNHYPPVQIPSTNDEEPRSPVPILIISHTPSLPHSSNLGLSL